MNYQSLIRNFAIVAHIDHGKSTLADRLLEATHTIELRDMEEQILDSNPIERERGITIKLAPVRMKWKDYILNLIDTPGHVDFSYEVSRSLSACEGIILVVDATQGIQAQTMAHMQLIRQNKLKVIPVINKIDLPTAKISETRKALCETFSFKSEEIIEISAKSGTNINQVLEAIVQRIPSPQVQAECPFKALVFSSVYDTHKGVVIFIKVVEGNLDMKQFASGQGDALKFFASRAEFFPVEIGFFTPKMKSEGKIAAGEVGYVATGLKDLSLAKVGDTLCMAGDKVAPLGGFKEPQPMVYLSLFPVENDDFQKLRESLEKLHLSDSSFTYKLFSSPALGKGYLCGFLGLLHAEIVKERLEKEFYLNLIATAPTVEYRVTPIKGEIKFIHSPNDYPDPSFIKKTEEPVMYTVVYTPNDTVGAVMQLCQEKRAQYVNLEYFGNQAKFTYIIPLSEMIVDFFDKLKSVTQGYASLDYEFYDFSQVDVVKLDVLINRERVDAFSQIIVKEKSLYTGVNLVEKLKTLIPRHQFQVPIQAAIGGKIIARADVKSFRKDVTQKLYGGDQTRKDKLLEAQRKGKKKMRQFGKVEIPQEAFLEIYK